MFCTYFGIYISCIFILLCGYIRSYYDRYELKRVLDFSMSGRRPSWILTIFVGENYTKFKDFLVSVSYPNVCLRMENYSRIQLIFLDC